MQHRQIFKALGPHRLACKSTLQLVSKKSPRTIRQAVRLRIDGQGNLAARKNTHRQYGQEVILLDGWLYSRHRYGKFVKRRPRKGEAVRRANAIAGLLPAYLQLLGHAITIIATGKAFVRGKIRVIEVKLGLADKPLPPAPNPRRLARRWRKTIEIKKITGRALLHEATGAPLEVKLEAQWSFAAPGNKKRAGIPIVLSRDREEMRLEFSQQLKLGGKIEISAPPADELVADARRLRLEMERQFVTGERQMPESWPEVLVLPEPGRKK